MTDKKFNLVELTQEEKESFMKDFGEFLNSKSVYFEPVPQFTRKSLNDPWEIVTQLFLQKKEVEETPGVVDAEVIPTDETIPEA